METWKPVVGYETHYEVSDLGKVRRIRAATGARVGKVLKDAPMTSKYRFVVLCMDCKPKAHSVHRLVAAAFIGPCPEGQEVNHKNGIREDNRLANLEYMTRQQNIIHGQRTLPRKQTSLRGEMVPNAKLTEQKVREIKKRLANGESQKTIADDFGVVRQVIWGINHGRWWKWVK